MIITAGSAKTATTAGATAVEIQMDMSPGRQYRITARNAPLWFNTVVTGGTDPTVGGDDCHYVPTGGFMLVSAQGARDSANIRNRIKIIRDGATDASGILSMTTNV